MSQRALAGHLGTGASRVNRLLKDLMSSGYIEVVDEGVRPFAYKLTDAGRTYSRKLRNEHYRSVVENYRAIEGRIRRRLRRLKEDGIRRLLLYGTGSVMDAVRVLAEDEGLEVLGAVDETAGVPLEPAAVRDACAVLMTTLKAADDPHLRIETQVGKAVRVVEL